MCKKIIKKVKESKLIKFIQEKIEKLHKKDLTQRRILLELFIILASLSIITTVYQFEKATRTFGILIMVVGALFFGIIVMYILFKKDEMKNEFHSKNDQLITYVIGRVFGDNILELFISSGIALLIIFNLAVYLSKLIEVYPDSVTPLVIAIFISTLSVGISIIGIYYAYLAEQKAERARKNSKKLLDERGAFLNDFLGFINRINRKISTSDDKDNFDSIYKDAVSLKNGNENYLIRIKCMFLTPFLGHAGLTINDKAVYKAFVDLQTSLDYYIRNPFCEVLILTPEPKKIFEWYRKIIWFEELKNIVKDQKCKYYKDLDNKILDLLKKYVIDKMDKKFINGESDHEKGRKYLKSYEHLVEYYKSRYSEEKIISDDIKLKKVQFANYNNIPYQMVLVTICPDIHDRQREQSQFAIITYVGYDTYNQVKKSLVQKKCMIDKTGIHSLLTKLHSAFYISDMKHCDMLNNQYNNIWNVLKKEKLSAPCFNHADYVQFINNYKNKEIYL